MVDVEKEAFETEQFCRSTGPEGLAEHIKTLCAKVETQKAASVLENAIGICDAFAKIWKAQGGHDFAEAAMRIVQRLEMELAAYSPGSGPVQK